MDGKYGSANLTPSRDIKLNLNTEDNTTTFSKTHQGYGKFRLNTTSSKFRKTKPREQRKQRKQSEECPKSPKMLSVNVAMNQMNILEQFSEKSRFKKYDPVNITFKKRNCYIMKILG